jgi:predicted ATPase
MQGRFQIDRLVIKNFRSIRECDVQLAPITFFVGPNASGKTCIVDALLFIAQAVRHSLERSVQMRGGVQSVLHAPVKFPSSTAFHLDLSSSTGFLGHYRLVLTAQDFGSVLVSQEECLITDTSGEQHHYLVQDGIVQGSAPVFPAVSSDRLFLVNASGLPEFRAIYDFLFAIDTVEPATSVIYEITRGRSVNDLTTRYIDLYRNHPDRLEIIQQYLRKIAPPFERVEVDESNHSPSLRFVEKSFAASEEIFHIVQVSSGLLNSAEILLSLFEPSRTGGPASPVVIEEPEALLHPGAVHVIRDGLLEASEMRQLLVTSHSPDLLDDPAIPAEWIRTVYRDERGTHVSPLDSGTKSVLHDRLYTAGELLRQGGLVTRS